MKFLRLVCLLYTNWGTYFLHNHLIKTDNNHFLSQSYLKALHKYLFFNKNKSTINWYNKIKSTESVLTFSSCVRTKPYFNFAVLFRMVPIYIKSYSFFE